MVNIIHKIAVKAPLANVYAALSTVEGVASWWSRETSGESTPGGAVHVLFRTPTGTELGRIEFDVVELDPNKKVHWRIKSGPAEWIGTDVTFELSQDGDSTLVLFAHKNWREAVDFMAHCSMKWATFLLSLKALGETGKGKPAPEDFKIDTWN
jgi:uncharacterized protein YndB with AHSA1/START domain